MSATLQTPVKIGPYLFRYEWTGTPPFRVFDYDRYQYIYTDTDLTRLEIASRYENQPTPIQVLDSTEGNPDGVTYPGIARVQWRGQAHASKYEVDNGLTILNWTPETGEGYYEYVFQHDLLSTITDQLISLTTYDSEGNTVNTQLPSTSLVSVPNMFNFNLSYDSGTTTITVGAV